MYYRRKVILSLLEIFEGKLNKTNFQKLLFLFSKLQKKPAYHFVPYKYGCVSFQSYADLRTMIKYDLIKEEDNGENSQNYWKKNDSDSFLISLTKDDQKLLSYLKRRFSNYSTRELISYTYQKYPFYAINSTIAHEILNKEELEKIRSLKPKSDKNALYTIGYQGISLEEYLNRLIKKDIKVLCDVRKNSLSMKFGFSKKQLKSSCEKLGILFYHFPEVGIRSEKRKELNSQKDYDDLFAEYRNDLQQENSLITQKSLIELINNHQRVAITCFEADINQCHRKHLAEKIAAEATNLPVIHI